MECYVHIDRGESECPHESNCDHVIVEVWSPQRSDPASRVPSRFLSTNNNNGWKKLVHGGDGEDGGGGGGLNLFLQGAPSTEILSAKELDALKQRVRNGRCWHEVLIVFYFYAHRPRSLGKNVPCGIQHTSTAVLYLSHLFSQGTVTLYSTHHVETKWIGGPRQHVRLDVTFRGSAAGGAGRGRAKGGSPRPDMSSVGRYWEECLQEIWDQGILPDIKWVQQPGIRADEFEKRCEVMTPLSVPVHGVPVTYGVEVDGRVYNDQFAVSKGLTAQSLWYIPDERIVSDDWIRGMLRDILGLRGVSIDDFTRPTATRPLSRETQQKFLSDVVKLVTYHAATWPYFPDTVTVRRPDDGVDEEVPIDDMDPARIKPGDCEDVASISVQIACDILRRRDVTCPIIASVQYYLAMLGVPCGVSGRVLGGTSGGHLHVYGVFIPLPMFESLVASKAAGSTAAAGTASRPYVLETYGLDPADIPLHCALIEGTVLSSPFYTAREHVDARKVTVCLELEEVLRQVAGEDNVMQWNNYCVPQAWTLRPALGNGRHAHLEILRIFPCMPELILGPAAATGGERGLARSYLMTTRGAIGVAAQEFLGGFASMREFEARMWRAEPTFRVPARVVELEKEVIRHFHRPVTRIHYNARGCDRDVNKWPVPGESEEVEVLDELRKRYCRSTIVPTDPNRRVVLYVWKLVRGEGELVLNEILTRIPTLKVARIQRLGHGFAVVFSLLGQVLQ